MTILLGDGLGGLAVAHDYPTLGYPYSIQLGDLNLDGHPDIVVGGGNPYGTYGHAISVHLGNGDGTFQSKVDYPTDTNPIGVALGDLNNDGKLDVVVENYTSRTLSVLLGVGDGTLTSGSTVSNAVNCRFVTLGDVDGDGNLDAVTSNVFDNAVAVFRGKGDGTLEFTKSYGVGANPGTIQIVDLTGDGRPDLLVADEGTPNLEVLRNRGTWLVGVPSPLPPSVGLFLKVTPNPGRGAVLFEYKSPEMAATRIEVFDPSGRRVAIIRRGSAPGETSARWDGLTDSGKRARPGLYYARLTAGSSSVSRAFVWLER